MAERRPEDDNDNRNSQPTVAGCLLLLVSLAVIFGVAIPVVRWRNSETGRLLPRMVAIVVPVLAGAIVHGLGTAILKIVGLPVLVKSKPESSDGSDNNEASSGSKDL